MTDEYENLDGRIVFISKGIDDEFKQIRSMCVVFDLDGRLFGCVCALTHRHPSTMPLTVPGGIKRGVASS